MRIKENNICSNFVFKICEMYVFVDMIGIFIEWLNSIFFKVMVFFILIKLVYLTIQSKTYCLVCKIKPFSFKDSLVQFVIPSTKFLPPNSNIEDQ